MSSNSSKQENIELCKTKLCEFFDEITREYELIGTTPELIADHHGEISGHLESFLDDLLEQVRTQRVILTEKLDVLYEKYVALMRRFRDEFLIQKDLMPLIKLSEYLEKHVKKLEQQLRDSLEEIAKLNGEMADICRSLGSEPEQLHNDPLPTRPELDTFRQKIEALQSQKYALIEELIQKKNRISQLATDINYKPESETESLLIFGHDSSFVLSAANFVALNELIEKLTARHDERNAHLNVLQTQLGVLSKCLRKSLNEPDSNVSYHRQMIDVAEANRVTEDFLLCEKINYFASEIKKGERIKQENQEKYLNELKKQITEMWMKCMYGEQQKNEFFPYLSTEVTNEQIALCEQHLNHLTMYYETNKSIFETFSKWQFFWDEHTKIEETESDKSTNRYKNRGCTLLQEERRRNLVEKKLHLFESKLIEESHEYKSRNGKAFIVHDNDVIEVIKSKQAEFKALRESRLREKKLMRSGTPSTLSSAMSTISLSAIRSGQSTPVGRYLTPQPQKPNSRILTPLVQNRRSGGNATPCNVLGSGQQSRLMQKLKSVESKAKKRRISARRTNANQNVPPLRRKLPVQLSNANGSSIVVKGKRMSSSFSSKRKQTRLSINRNSLNYADFIENIPDFSSSRNGEPES